MNQSFLSVSSMQINNMMIELFEGDFIGVLDY